eukprot:328295-Prorocentrum_minimum.AAC.1
MPDIILQETGNTPTTLFCSYRGDTGPNSYGNVEGYVEAEVAPPPAASPPAEFSLLVNRNGRRYRQPTAGGRCRGLRRGGCNTPSARLSAPK